MYSRSFQSFSDTLSSLLHGRQKKKRRLEKPWLDWQQATHLRWKKVGRASRHMSLSRRPSSRSRSTSHHVTGSGNGTNHRRRRSARSAVSVLWRDRDVGHDSDVLKFSKNRLSISNLFWSFLVTRPEIPIFDDIYFFEICSFLMNLNVQNKPG